MTYLRYVAGEAGFECDGVRIDLHKNQNLSRTWAKFNTRKVLNPFESYIKSQRRLLDVITKRHEVLQKSGWLH